MISSIHRYSHVLLALALLVTSSAAGAQDIDALYEQGQSAFEAGRFEEARSKFASVWEQRKSYDVAAVLAQTELQVGRNADAAQHLAYAVAHFPVSAKTDARKKIEAAFAEVRAKVGAIKLEVTPASASLKVNGRAIAEGDRRQAIFVEPGQVTIEVTADGYEPAKKTLEAKKGGADVVSLVLSPKAVPTITPTASASATAPPPRSKVPGFVMGGVGVASLIAGGVLVGVAAASGADIESKSSAIRIAGVGCPADPRCAGLESSARSGDTMSRAGVGLLIGGAALGAGGLLYWLWPAEQKSQGAVRLVPTASVDGVGLTISGAM